MRFLSCIPIKVKEKRSAFNLINSLKYELLRKIKLKDGDILAISGKYISLSEKRFYKLEYVKSILINDPYQEIVIRESTIAWKSLPGLLLSIAYNILCPNSGIDRSNVKPGSVMLYVSNPNKKAEVIRLTVLLHRDVYIGVIIVDSRIYPLRRGTVGIAIGCAGIKSITDERGKLDIFNRKLKMTKKSIVDNLASTAQLFMGEANECIPFVIIRGLDQYVEFKNNNYNLYVNPDSCIFLRALKSKPF